MVSLKVIQKQLNCLNIDGEKIAVSSDHKVNDQIRAKNVRLVTEGGSEVLPIREALNRARTEDMDLVEINESNGVPVCKIMNYGKFKYEQSKREKELAKKARATQLEMKEIQLRPVTDINDINVKAKKVKKFIEAGHKVKIMIKFRGREMSHTEIGLDVINKLVSQIGVHKVERPATINGRDMIMIIAPEKVVEASTT